MKNRIPLIALGGVGLVALWYLVVFAPYMAQRRAIGTELATQQTQLNDFNNTLSMLPLAVRMNEQLQQKLAQENSKLYAKGNLLRLFDDIKRKALTCHLDLEEISPPVSELLALNRNVPDSASPQFLNLTVGLTGTFAELGQFVTDLEQSPYFRSINSCSVTALTATSGELEISIGFRAMLGVLAEGS